MKIQHRWPLLATLFVTRRRAGVSSVGMGLAILFQCIAGLEAYLGRHDSATGIIGTSLVILALSIPMMVAFAARRERDRLGDFSASAYSEHQIITAIIFGPVWIEWAWSALTAGAFFLYLRIFNHLTASTVLGVTFGAVSSFQLSLLAVHFTVPRPHAFTGHYLSLGCVYLVFIGVVGDAMAEAMWTGETTVLIAGAGVALFCVWLIWARTGELIRRLPPTRITFASRYIALVIPGLVVAFWEKPWSPHPPMLMAMIVPYYFAPALAVMTAAMVWWDNLSHPQLNQTLWRVGIYAGLSLIVALVLPVFQHYGQFRPFGRYAAVLATVVVLAMLLRYAVFVASLAWSRRRFFIWQSLALTVSILFLELAGLVCRGIGVSHGSNVDSLWTFGARVLSSHPISVLTNGTDWPDSVVASERLWVYFGPPLVSVLLSILALAAFWFLNRDSGTFLIRSVADTRQVKRNRTALIHRAGAALSPLLPVLLLRSFRTVRITTPVQVGAILITLTIGVAMATSSLVLSTAIMLWRVLVFVEVGVFMAICGDFFAAVSHDRTTGMLRTHLVSGIALWRVAIGYFAGPSLCSFLVVMAIASIVLALGIFYSALGGLLQHRMALPAVAQGLTATAVAASSSPVPRRDGVVVLVVIFGGRWATARSANAARTLAFGSIVCTSTARIDA